jgi:hypothetical protein
MLRLRTVDVVENELCETILDFPSQAHNAESSARTDVCLLFADVAVSYHGFLAIAAGLLVSHDRPGK